MVIGLSIVDDEKGCPPREGLGALKGLENPEVSFVVDNIEIGEGPPCPIGWLNIEGVKGVVVDIVLDNVEGNKLEDGFGKGFCPRNPGKVEEEEGNIGFVEDGLEKRLEEGCEGCCCCPKEGC